MGLFSRKKTISVSSVVYNLAGDIKERVQYLPSTIATSVVAENNVSISETIQSAILGGPGIRMRSFGRWARTKGYSTAIGLQTGNFISGDSIDTNVLSSLITHGSNQVVSIQTAEIGAADYGYWADQWMLENHPERVNEEYVIDFSELINTVYITFPDTTVYSFNPVGFNPLAQYLYVSYNLTDTPVDGPVIEGSEHTVSSPAGYPSTVGWTNLGTTSTPGSMPLVTTVEAVASFSDGRPNETNTTTTPSTGMYSSLDTEYQLKTYHGQILGTLDAVWASNDFQHNMSTGVKKTVVTSATTTETIAGGVTKTTVTTTTTESVGTAYSYRTDYQEVIEKSWSTMKVMIYQKNTGVPEFDLMFAVSESAGRFYPFIPIRQNNTFLSDSYLPDVYEKSVKAYKKATGQKYGKLIDSIKDNDSLGDIDHGYLVYGVSLNSEEKASKKYVYRYFQTLMQQGAGGVDEYNAWQINWAIANNSVLAWNSWKTDQGIPGSLLFGSIEPARIPYPAVPAQRVSLVSGSLNFNMSIVWSSMEETTGTGLGRPGAKMGDLWWTQGSTITYEEVMYSGKNNDGTGVREVVQEFISLHWQDGNNSHRTISIWGLFHANVIYKGKGVYISGKEALGDVEESGFLVPLHEDILKSMSLKDSTQMSTACTYIVFNCYTVTKQKWYATTWFKVILIIIVIVITVVTAGAGSPSAGLLGPAAAIGTTLGFAGTMAIIIGSIVNAIAAMILTKIITAGATALFGDKVGAVVGAIASVIAVAYGSGTLDTTSMATSFSSLSTAQNLMALTLSAGKGYVGYMQAGTQDILAQTEELLKNYQAESRTIAAAYSDNLGYGATLIDPLALTEANNSFIPETANSFLSRTLLVGGDIADLTNTMITNFAAMTTTVDLPS